MSAQRTLPWLVAAALGAVVAATHWPALRAQALSIDDPQYFSENPLVQTPGAASAWRFLREIRRPSTVEGYYHPLTMISLMADHAWGARPGQLFIAHCTGLLLHVLTTLLIFTLLQLLFGHVWSSALAALLYGVHPLTVEHVVWLGQRKGALAMFFCVAALVCYVAYTRRGRVTWYLATVGALLLALLAKPAATPLPVLMLILDYWPLRRLTWKRVVEKVPLMLISLAGLAVSILSNAPTVGVQLGAGGASQTALLACAKFGLLLGKCVWPAHLTAYYVAPAPVTPAHPAVAAGIGVLVALAIAAVAARRYTRAGLAVALFVLAATGPVLGLIRYSPVYFFNTYACLPLLGMVLLAAAAGAAAFQRAHRRTGLDVLPAVAALLAAIALAWTTRGYLRTWRDTETHYQHLLAHAPAAPVLHMNLGIHYRRTGQLAAAEAALRRALALRPDYADAQFNYALVLRDAQRYGLACLHLDQLLARQPDYWQAALLKAELQAAQGMNAEASAAYRVVLKCRPDAWEVRLRLAQALAASQRLPEAEQEARHAVRQSGGVPAGYMTLGSILAQQAQYTEAAEHFTRAGELQPDDPQPWHHLGLLRLLEARFSEARTAFTRAQAIDPRFIPAQIGLGDALRQGGDRIAALEVYRRAVQIDPRSADAHFALGMMLLELGQPAQGRREIEESLRLDPGHRGANLALDRAR